MDRIDLAAEFESMAKSRRSEAVKRPEDDRLAGAADLLGELADSVDDLPDALVDMVGELFEDEDYVEIWRGLLKQVGFRNAPDTAEEFCRHFVAECSSA
jgi:hypothetical protein